MVRELWLAYVTFLDCPRMAAAFQIAVPAVADPSIPEGLEGESDDDADVDSARSQALRLYHFQLNETLAAALLYCSAAHLRLPTWSLEDCRSLVSLSGHVRCPTDSIFAPIHGMGDTNPGCCVCVCVCVCASSPDLASGRRHLSP